MISPSIVRCASSGCGRETRDRCCRRRSSLRSHTALRQFSLRVTVASSARLEGGVATCAFRRFVSRGLRLRAVQCVTTAFVALLSASFAHAEPPVPPVQFELIGASDEWLAFRENIREDHDPLADCGYPGD